MASEFVLPELGEGVEKGDIVAVSISPGDIVKPGQSVVELETDKATVDVPFEKGGKIIEVLVSVGDNVKIGAPLFRYQSASAEGAAAAPATEKQEVPESKKPDEKEPEKVKAASPPSPEVPEKEEKASGSVPAGPAARRVAREKNIDIGKVTGSGPRGRISVEDVEAFAASKPPAAPQAAGSPSFAVQMPDFSKFGEISREPFSNVRRATARHLSLSWNTAPHVTQHNLVNVTDLEIWRKQNAGAVEKAGGKLTVTAIIVKVVAHALRKFPNFNASIDMEKEEVILKDYVNIGIAVDTPRGLLVPVMRDVDRKSITEISIEIGEISGRARDKKTGLEELAGGCFTVTNLGGIGGHFFTPILNHPEVGILGVSRSRIEPVYEDGEFVAAEMLPLSLSYDHRLIDGADAARFVKWISNALEDPMSMLL